MEIQIKSQKKIPGLKNPKIRQNLKKVLNDLGCHDKELSLFFTDDAHIAKFNEKYLDREGPTNVIAFPMSGGPEPDWESGMMGDVVISVDTAMEESKRADESLEKTIYRLLIHGILHLLDYDHERSPADSLRMEKEQTRLLSLITED